MPTVHRFWFGGILYYISMFRAISVLEDFVVSKENSFHVIGGHKSVIATVIIAIIIVSSCWLVVIIHYDHYFKFFALVGELGLRQTKNWDPYSKERFIWSSKSKLQKERVLRLMLSLCGISCTSVLNMYFLVL